MKETIRAYTVRNMLSGMLDDIGFLIRIDNENKPIEMDKETLENFKKARTYLYDLANQQRSIYPELIDK